MFSKMVAKHESIVATSVIRVVEFLIVLNETQKIFIPQWVYSMDFSMSHHEFWL